MKQRHIPLSVIRMLKTPSRLSGKISSVGSTHGIYAFSRTLSRREFFFN